MKKDINKINKFKMEQNKVARFRERINMLIKVVGIIVLALIIVGMANDKNGVESVSEYQSEDSKRLNVSKDIRIARESEANKNQERIELKESNKVEEKIEKRNNNEKKYLK